MTSSSDLSAQLRLVEVKPGKKFPLATLKALLPDVETVLFFGKVYDLNHRQLSNLLAEVVGSPLTDALFREGTSHSNELQDYIGGIIGQAGLGHRDGELVISNEPTHVEVLPHVWESLEVEIADSIKTVASKLESTLDVLPGKQGAMVFQTMAVMNKKRPTLGDYRARIVHPPAPDNLVIFDVSGSMSEHTVRTIVDDVVELGYKANAHLVIVSNNAYHWEPGTYNTASVLRAAEFAGTHYEMLRDILDRDWGTVVTIADYDSSRLAKSLIEDCIGTVQEVLDISLVNKPTFLAECVGQLAQRVRPLLVGNSYDPL